MTVSINNNALVERLWNHYQAPLADLLVSQRTGASLEISDEWNSRAQLLSVALYDPQVGLVWGNDLAYSQLAIWQPYIESSKKRFITLSRSLKREGPISGLDHTPSYALKSGFSLAGCMAAPSLRTLVYITDKNENLGFLRALPKVVHVCGHHGDSDKHSSFSRLPSAYDFLLVSDGNSALRYLKADIQMSPERMIPIGNTVVKDAEFSRTAPEFARLLYAPTFEGYSETANFSSVLRAGKAIAAWHDDGSRTALLRAHPGTGKREAKYKKANTEFPQSEKTAELKAKAAQFNWSDFLICDISGVLSEYLFTGKPIILPVSSSDKWIEEYLNKTTVREYIYIWDYNKKALAEFIESIRSDPLKEARLKRRSLLYAGAESFAESSTLFEAALDYFEHSYRWREIRQGNYTASSQAEPLRLHPLPDDPELADIAKKIIRGEASLRAS